MACVAAGNGRTATAHAVGTLPSSPPTRAAVPDNERTVGAWGVSDMGSMSSRRAASAACVLNFVVGVGAAHALDAYDARADEVIVTATRTATSLDATLAPISVLTAQDIEQSQVLSFQDLMRGQPGIQLSNNGGLGKATALFVRGTNADQVLVLVDGVRIENPFIGVAKKSPKRELKRERTPRP